MLVLSRRRAGLVSIGEEETAPTSVRQCGSPKIRMATMFNCALLLPAMELAWQPASTWRELGLGKDTNNLVSLSPLGKGG